MPAVSVASGVSSFFSNLLKFSYKLFGTAEFYEFFLVF